MDNQKNKSYWRANLCILGGLLTAWFIVGFGCSILWVDALDKIPFFGFKLGFWFAQQGAIYGFVLLILIYVKLMNRLDAQMRDQEEGES